MHYLANTNSDLHFLVVNDSEASRRLIVHLLKELGYMKVSEASNGEMALRSFKSARAIGSPIGFVITDCAMPVMDGLKLVQQIRGDEQLRATPLLMVTADATREHILAASEAGADDYLVKPFNATKLRQKISPMIAKYALAA
ncbi:response regulator [Actimicrobium antarcticum]|uniref:Chemotaxis response regulator CheY n=1 Tax=Actimicrobium antarcticum TaxID=1051899 RepID=A0ABP7SW15_9BURK